MLWRSTAEAHVLSAFRRRVHALRRAGSIACALALASLMSATSCSDEVGDVDGGVLGPDAGMWWTNAREIHIEPTEVTLAGGPMMSSTQAFHVTAVFNDGRRRDVTRAVAYEVTPTTVGTIDAGVFRTSMIAGGDARVFARAGRLMTSALVHVRWTAQANGPMVPADVPGRFAMATPDATAMPAVVYPNDQTLFPPNISNLEVHWRAPMGSTEFHDLVFENMATNVHYYVQCTPMGGGCVAPIDATVWRWISNTNRGAAMPLELRVRSLLTTNRVAASSPVRMSFAPDNVEGGIYYWTAAGMANGIYRYDFLRGDRAPQAFYTQPDTPRNHLGEQHSCTGCHALSLDGTRLATVVGGGHVGDVVMLDVGSRRVVAQRIERYAQLLSFSPDGSQIISALDGQLRLLTGSDLSVVRTLDTGGPATHPEWSPAGNGIVFSRMDEARDSIWTRHGAIQWFPAMGASFGPAQTLVAQAPGENHYYPSNTPDGRWVVYNRSVCPGGDLAHDECNGYDDPSAALWMVDSSLPTHRAIELANANRRGPTDTRDTLTNSWPRVSPFTSLFTGRRVYWLTFSSKRNYGLRLVGMDRPQLWMVAVAVPDTETQQPLSADPSFAAFWLPFQDIATGNHIAQWTRTIVPIGAPTP